MTKYPGCVGKEYFIHKYSSRFLRLVFRWWQKKVACTGANKLIDFFNKVGGNDVKLERAVNLWMGIRMMLK